MRRLHGLFLALLLMLLPWTPAKAQTEPAEDRTTLVADSVTVESDQVLVAKGNVEVFFKNQHLTASEISYDKAANRLTITGPIRIESGESTVILADQADISADLTEGLLTSARLVLDQRLELAASAILQSDSGRYTTLRNVVASSCTICKGSTTPLWEIRSKEVVHDVTKQQIWFSHATLRFLNVPLLYVPILRVPDPSVTRANGFLIPRLVTTSTLGLGVKLPYFFALGPSKDLLVTPYFTVNGDHTVALRYRQAFNNGTLLVNTAVSQDNILPGEPRGYLSVIGGFDLGNRYSIWFNGIVVSDPDYLSDYGITGADPLESNIVLSRVQRDTYFMAEAINLHTLHVSRYSPTQPSFVTELTYQRRFEPAILGGTANLEFQTHTHYRAATSSADQNGDGIGDGRDLERVSVLGDWQRNWTLDNGIQITTEAHAIGDRYSIHEDEIYAGTPFRGTGIASVLLRWPWVKAGKNGGTQLIEPVVQLVSSSPADPSIPNEDSTLVEFDESNLFSVNRYPGSDAIEAGTRLNIGMNYLLTTASGQSVGMTVGRVLRFSEENQFSATSGLHGTASDWLVAGSWVNGTGLTAIARLLVGDEGTLSRGEMRFGINRPHINLFGGYEYLQADLTEDRPNAINEFVATGSIDLNRFWKLSINNRYDVVAQNPSSAVADLTYRIECLAVDLSVSRTYQTSSSVDATTEFSVSVELLGFGGSSSAGSQQVCRR